MARILVVDDSATVRKLITHTLLPTGHECIEAADGIEALEKMARTPVDLVLADLNMPKMNGLELVSTIREDPAYVDIPIVMLTTEGSEEDRRRGLQAGANVYLVKPTPPHMLLYKVESLLGNVQADEPAQHIGAERG